MNGTFYRLADKTLQPGDPTNAASWLRPYETLGSPLYRKYDDPEAHGLSIFSDALDLRNMRDLSPWARKKSVAEVTITETQGVLKYAQIEGSSSHHDWWTEPFDLLPEATIIEAGR